MKRKMTLTASGVLAAAAITGLMVGSAHALSSPAVGIGNSSSISAIAGTHAFSTVSETADKHDCKGKNGCKGQGGCKTDKNECKGHNDCKGQGGCATDGSHK